MVRVPRVSRLEIFLEFLQGINEGLDRVALEERIAKQKQFFETEKYKALGRGAPFSEARKKKLMVAGPLMSECMKLAGALGLLETGSTPLTLSGNGANLLVLEREKQKVAIAQLLLSCYGVFAQFLLTLSEASGKKLSLPDVRHTQEHQKFRQLARSFSLDIDMWSFASMRDLMWQLGYINWYPEKRGEETWFTVYLTSDIREDLGNSPAASISKDGKTYFIKSHIPSIEEFETALWGEYMKLTSHVHYRSVFYSDLRTSVCTRIQVADPIFDQMLRRLVAENRELNIIWSAGTIPYSRDSKSQLKNLPARAPNGQYMVYLKVGKK